MANPPSLWYRIFLFFASFVVVCAVFAEPPNPTDSGPIASRTPVGVASKIFQVVIAGSELEAKPIEDRKSPLVVRVLATFRHGSDFRYDLEYYGLEPGRYDLRDYLQRKDRSSLESAQPLTVEIESHLPPGQILPSNPSATSLPNLGGYRTLMAVLAGAWLLITLWLIFGGRRAKAVHAEDAHIPTPAEQLRPLVIEAIAGRLSPAGQAELERVLLRYWRQRLNLEDTDPVVALTILRDHPEAGKLLRMVEDWLHRPGGAGKVDVAAILAPYQQLDGNEESKGTHSTVDDPSSHELFSDEARHIFQLAKQEALRFNHEYVGTEHILLGLVKHGAGVGPDILKNQGVDLRKIRLEAEKLIQAGPEMVVLSKWPMTPRAKQVIEYALEEAQNLNHNCVDTEHLLLGLLREQEGVAAQVLMNLGVSLAMVRDEVLMRLGQNPIVSPPASQGA